MKNYQSSLKHNAMKEKIILSVIIVIVIIGTLLFWRKRIATPPPSNTNQTQQAQVPAINGVLVDESVAKTRPIAVVVENHNQARPQSGLTDADIIYETLAEGGITRFLAIFQTHQPKEIGPIRSARPYFNFLANSWRAVYAHVGGSTQALSELNSDVYRNLNDINQFFNGDYFYRSKDRVAPHNAYSTVELLRDLITKKKWQDWQPVSLGEYKAIPTDQLKTDVTKISAKFFDPLYAVDFAFDPTTNTYLRSNAGKPALDKNNNLQISPKNVMVQYVDDYVIPLETVNGVGLSLDKNGRAILFTGGTAVDGSWQYSNSKTTYTTKDNQPMQFQPGQTWIILMPKSLSNNVTWQ
jgi:hypothetical protein